MRQEMELGFLHTEILEAGFHPRVDHALLTNGIKTIFDLTRWSEKDLKKIRGIGNTSIEQINRVLGKRGLHLEMDWFQST